MNFQGIFVSAQVVVQLTTGQVTSSPLTTGQVTSSAATTGEITSSVVSTGQETSVVTDQGTSTGEEAPSLANMLQFSIAFFLALLFF